MAEEDVRITVLDRIAVGDLVARYNWAIDSGDGPAVAACFVPDGTFTGATGRYAGPEELQRLTATVASPARGVVPLMHWVGNMVITRAGSGLRLRAYGLVVSASSGSPRVYLAGHYDDRLVWFDDDLLFSERTFTPLESTVAATIDSKL